MPNINRTSVYDDDERNKNMNNMSKEEKAAAKEQYYARKNKLMKLENETSSFLCGNYENVWYNGRVD